MTAAIVMAVFFNSGVAALWPVLILAILEITFSFDNAVLNSEILGRMNRLWRILFLTLGIAIAVFGVRLLLPFLMVAITADQSITHVVDIAFNHPDEYSKELHEGYPLIAAFGGIFLLMIGLRFLAEDRETRWLSRIEKPIAKLGRPWLIPLAGAVLGILAMVTVLRPGDSKVLTAGLIGVTAFLLIKGASAYIEKRQQMESTHTGNFVNFLYLELLDGSFSVDGVIAAFAITKDVILISAGLAIGALYVRSMTLHLLERGTLQSFRYLLHGAHYAIIILGIVLVLSMRVELPEAITGLIGVTIIAAALISSILHNRRDRQAA